MKQPDAPTNSGCQTPTCGPERSRFRTDFALENGYRSKLADTKPETTISCPLGSAADRFVQRFSRFHFRDIKPRPCDCSAPRHSNRDQFQPDLVRQNRENIKLAADFLERRPASKHVHAPTTIANDFLYPGLNANLSFMLKLDGPSFEINETTTSWSRPRTRSVQRSRHESIRTTSAPRRTGTSSGSTIRIRVLLCVRPRRFGPLAGREVDINAAHGSDELSLNDRDWGFRFPHVVFVLSSGTRDRQRRPATGNSTRSCRKPDFAEPNQF